MRQPPSGARVRSASTHTAASASASATIRLWRKRWLANHTPLASAREHRRSGPLARGSAQKDSAVLIPARGVAREEVADRGDLMAPGKPPLRGATSARITFQPLYPTGLVARLVSGQVSHSQTSSLNTRNVGQASGLGIGRIQLHLERLGPCTDCGQFVLGRVLLGGRGGGGRPREDDGEDGRRDPVSGPPSHPRRCASPGCTRSRAPRRRTSACPRARCEASAPGSRRRSRVAPCR
jgi:hypothetical protein